MIYRNGLAESLEEFAARCGLHPEQARYTWQAYGLDYLFASAPYPPVPMVRAGARIAPGVAVPTSNRPTEMEES